MDFANFLTNYEEAVSMILFGIGFSNLLMQKNLIKKIVGMNIMDTSVYLFLALKGYIAGHKAPIRLYNRYHTLDLDEISTQLKKEGL